MKLSRLYIRLLSRFLDDLYVYTYAYMYMFINYLGICLGVVRFLVGFAAMCTDGSLDVLLTGFPDLPASKLCVLGVPARLTPKTPHHLTSYLVPGHPIETTRNQTFLAARRRPGGSAHLDRQ